MEKENYTIAIDSDTKDLIFDEEGLLETLVGKETSTQAVRLTLQVYKGEFEPVLLHGTDYEKIIGKKSSEIDNLTIEEVIQDAIFQEESVAILKSLSVTNEKNNVEVDFLGELESGEVISLEVNTS